MCNDHDPSDPLPRQFMEDRIDSGRVRVRTGALIVHKGALLLVKLHPPTRPHPFWMPPGGELELGETVSEAVVREVSEETGLIVEAGRLALIHEFIEPPWHAVEFYMICRPVGGELRLGLDPDRPPEHQILDEVRYVPFQELSELEVHPKIIAEEWRRLTDHEEEGVLHVRSDGEGRRV